jgi:hypothetical protein
VVRLVQRAKRQGTYRWAQCRPGRSRQATIPVCCRGSSLYNNFIVAQQQLVLFGIAMWLFMHPRSKQQLDVTSAAEEFPAPVGLPGSYDRAD